MLPKTTVHKAVQPCFLWLNIRTPRDLRKNSEKKWKWKLIRDTDWGEQPAWSRREKPGVKANGHLHPCPYSPLAKGLIPRLHFTISFRANFNYHHLHDGLLVISLKPQSNLQVPDPTLQMKKDVHTTEWPYSVSQKSFYLVQSVAASPCPFC